MHYMLLCPWQGCPSKPALPAAAIGSICLRSGPPTFQQLVPLRTTLLMRPVGNCVTCPNALDRQCAVMLNSWIGNPG